MKQALALEILKLKKNVFLTGEAGSGKTYTINIFKDWLREKGKRYAVTASTGIAATHIDGVTIHSFCGITKDVMKEEDFRKVTGNRFVVEKIQAVDVLIIDEISMLSGRKLDEVNRIFQDVRGDHFAPFGGVQVIFVGDFFQLPPVSKDRKEQFAFESISWQNANPVYCYLEEQHRQSDPTFTGILNSFRSETLTTEQKRLLVSNSVTEIPKTKLFTHNDDVDYLNIKELAKIKGDEYKFTMKESGNEFLVKKLKEGCLSPEILVLKIGAIVMFTKNNFDKGFVNGTLGKVIGIDDTSNQPIIETKDGDVIYVSREEWKIEENGIEKASIRQYPLRLAWAITVHKSQGMSLDSAVIDLSRAFEYGQGYVAISRVCSLSGLFLEGINSKAFLMHPVVMEKDKEFRAKSKDQEAEYQSILE